MQKLAVFAARVPHWAQKDTRARVMTPTARSSWISRPMLSRRRRRLMTRFGFAKRGATDDGSAGESHGAPTSSARNAPGKGRPAAKKGCGAYPDAAPR
jgi:hypothetical protein